MKKHIAEALKQIKFANEWDANVAEKEIEFWLAYMYHQGQIDLLEKQINGK